MQQRSREQYHHGDLRAALLEAATAMIAEGGVESVTLRALSERVGVSRTAPYRHFADKSALLAAVAEDGFHQLLGRLQALQHAAADPLARFQQMGVRYVAFAIERPTHYRLMFQSDIAGHAAHPGLGSAARAVFDTLVGAIRQCQAEQRVRPGDPRALAYTAWATVHGLSMLAIDRQVRGSFDVLELAHFTTRTLIDGMAV